MNQTLDFIEGICATSGLLLIVMYVTKTSPVPEAVAYQIIGGGFFVYAVCHWIRQLTSKD